VVESIGLRVAEQCIAQAQRRLPIEMDPPVVTKQNPEDNPILWVALAGPKPPQVVHRTAIEDSMYEPEADYTKQPL
jgi:multidrug efflux pump subunit AcrB